MCIPLDLTQRAQTSSTSNPVPFTGHLSNRSTSAATKKPKINLPTLCFQKTVYRTWRGLWANELLRECSNSPITTLSTWCLSRTIVFWWYFFFWTTFSSTWTTPTWISTSSTDASERMRHGRAFPRESARGSRESLLFEHLENKSFISDDSFI